MSGAVAKIPKPQLRGLLDKQLKTQVAISIVAGVVAGLGWKIFVADARKKRYAEFYRTYDPDAAFERMRQKGVFESCPAD